MMPPEKRAREAPDALLGASPHKAADGPNPDMDGTINAWAVWVLGERCEEGCERIGTDPIQGVLKLNVPPDGKEVVVEAEAPLPCPDPSDALFFLPEGMD